MPPVRKFTTRRRNLPHWEEPGAVYFLTWRTVGPVLEPADRTLTLDAVRFWDGRRWTVFAAVVMPNHVHVLARTLPLDPSEPGTYHGLSEVLHSIKGYTSHRINAARGRAGSVWQDERYDRIARDEDEFREKWEYVRNNPVKAGLVTVPEEYAWLYQSAYPY